MPLKGYKAHKTLHQDGGSDEPSVAGLSGLLADDQHVLDAEAIAAAQTIKLDDFATPDDNTDLNASITAHGLLKKLSNVATQYLDGTGAFSVPAGGGPTIVRKTADEIVNNSAVPQNDDELLLAVGANEKWLVLVVVFVTMTVTVGRHFKYGFAYPSGATVIFGHCAPLSGLWTTNTSTLTIPQSGASSKDFGIIGCVVVNSATAGNLNFQWAQAWAVAQDLTLKANSMLIPFKIA